MWQEKGSGAGGDHGMHGVPLRGVFIISMPRLRWKQRPLMWRGWRGGGGWVCAPETHTTGVSVAMLAGWLVGWLARWPARWLGGGGGCISRPAAVQAAHCPRLGRQCCCPPHHAGPPCCIAATGGQARGVNGALGWRSHSNDHNRWHP